ncbi:MAG: GIY-YIG nuclease family protein [Bacteroidetes bacterium]|nr:GIY-YIG nuclease family protein [Bacteroidota bacterium]
MHYTYILYSFGLDRFYKGSTQNMAERLKYHNGGYEKSTKSGVPWQLMWVAEKPNKSEAQKLEFKLKNLSRHRLIDFMNKYSESIAEGANDLFRDM